MGQILSYNKKHDLVDMLNKKKYKNVSKIIRSKKYQLDLNQYISYICEIFKHRDIDGYIVPEAIALLILIKDKLYSIYGEQYILMLLNNIDKQIGIDLIKILNVYSNKQENKQEKMCPICIQNQSNIVLDCHPTHMVCVSCYFEWYIVNKKSNICIICQQKFTNPILIIQV